MSKRKSNVAKATRVKSSGASSDEGTTAGFGQGFLEQYCPSPAAIREAVESLVVALMLAFLFRTFEAEAFVIPTGSMAPTLMGRHKDVLCPKCGFAYQVNASEEVDQKTNTEKANYQVAGSTCPLCRYTAEWDFTSTPSFSGDRLLVGKFAYEFADPRRWDVIVFRYPGEAKTNYIKRVVGLPHETVRIRHGNVAVRPELPNGSGQFTIARKPPDRLLAVLQPVFDNEHLPRLLELGWPARWRLATPQGPGAWQFGQDPRWLTTDGTSPSETWIRYEHLVPSYQQWQDLLQGRGLQSNPLRPQLITDITAYDTGRSLDAVRQNPAPGADTLGGNWVGDLVLECTLDVQSPTGIVLFELIKGGRRFMCQIDVASGKASLSIDGQADFHPTAVTAVRGPGSHRIRFSNVDDEMLLWVDDRVATFDAPTSYASLGNYRPQPSDLAPAGIGSRGAAVRVGRLRILRDLYYIAAPCPRGEIAADFIREKSPYAYATPAAVARFLSDPAQWGAFEYTETAEFPLAADQFLVLGDNSACSKDSRYWGYEHFEHYVSRDLLVGRAHYVYWPHSWDKVSIAGWEIPFPFFPNFGRMKFVR